MTRVTIEPIAPLTATYIAANARPIDRKEFLAVLPGQEMVGIAAGLAVSDSPGFVARLDGNPVLAFGLQFQPGIPHVAAGWAFGTDKTPRVLPAVTRFFNNQRGLMREIGLKRIEVRILPDNQPSIKWLTQTLGFEWEGDLEGFGYNGEMFIQLAWIDRNVP